MSVYATMRGEIEHADKSSYGDAANVLINGGWVDDQGDFLDEDGGLLADNCLDPDDLTITIPRGYHRNLLHVLPRLVEGARSVSGKWASTDGMFRGGSLSGKSDVDLEEWARDNGFGDRPGEDEDDDEIFTWMSDVAEAFVG
jgi:hypothetical protein